MSAGFGGEINLRGAAGTGQVPTIAVPTPDLPGGFGVDVPNPPIPAFEDFNLNFTYLDTDGALSTLTLDRENIAAEIQALQACVARHGRTRAAADCMFALRERAMSSGFMTPGFNPDAMVPSADQFVNQLSTDPVGIPGPVQGGGGSTAGSAGDLLGQLFDLLSSIPGIGPLLDLIGALGATAGAIVQVLGPLVAAGIIRGEAANIINGLSQGLGVTQMPDGTPTGPVAGTGAGGDIGSGDVSTATEANLLSCLTAIATGQSDANVQMACANNPEIQALLRAGSMVPGLAGGTGMRPNMMTCPGLFKSARSTAFRIPSRVYVDNPDGSVQVLINAGRATRGSREKSVLRSLAKENGFVVRRRGGR